MHKTVSFKFLNSMYLLLMAVLFLVCNQTFQSPQVQKRSDYLPPPVSIKNLTMGFRVQFADAFWLRAVQDFDYCNQKINETECKGKSWLFQVLNLVTELDPKIAPSMYQFSGLALTVLISDYEGASVIFDKAVQIYPDVWQINYAAAYHALYEEKDKIKASRLYFRAAETGAPRWVYSLASRISVDGGDREFSEMILKTLMDENKKDSVQSEVIDRIRAKLQQK